MTSTRSLSPSNLTLLSAAFVGITFFGFFFDIFASIGFVSLIFGFCRGYAGLQRGRAVGNGDFLPEYDPHAGSLAGRSRACGSCSMRSTAQRRRRDGNASTADDCVASCTRAATP